jgi:hypothetical protein
LQAGTRQRCIQLASDGIFVCIDQQNEAFVVSLALP